MGGNDKSILELPKATLLGEMPFGLAADLGIKGVALGSTMWAVGDLDKLGYGQGGQKNTIDGTQSGLKTPNSSQGESKKQPADSKDPSSTATKRTQSGDAQMS